jgi:hypothetical protein
MNITSQTYTPTEGVVTTLPSQTVPDQSLSLRELLLHYTRGGSLPNSEQSPAFFDENAFIPNLKKLDLVDIQEIMEDNAEKAEELQNNLKEIEKTKTLHKNKKEKDALTEQIKKDLADKSKQNNPE